MEILIFIIYTLAMIGFGYFLRSIKAPSKTGIETKAGGKGEPRGP